MKLMRYYKYALALTLLISNCLAQAADTVPKAARAVVRQVHAASARGDLSTLRGLMLSEFAWSFGGDASAGQAIDYWREHPEVLRALARATNATCDVQGDYVQCPKRADTGYRAGFKLTEDGWRMAYFVAGD